MADPRPPAHNKLEAIVQAIYPQARLLGFEPLLGGVSASVSALKLRHPDGREEQLVLRQQGTAQSSSDGPPSTRTQFALMRTLFDSGVAVPEPLLLDDAGEFLDQPFQVMRLVSGSIEVENAQQAKVWHTMGNTLRAIHELPIDDLPALPPRLNPLPEVLDFLQGRREWDALGNKLKAQTNTAYVGSPRLLHGDFWPGNLLWEHGELRAILDWEDAALGDPLSDVASARLEISWQYGQQAMQVLTDAYFAGVVADTQRLALWEVYVASAACKYMGDWGLGEEKTASMRDNAHKFIAEAAKRL